MYDPIHDKRFLILYLNIFTTATYGPIYGCVLDIEEERMVYETPLLGKFNYASPRDDGVIEIHLRGGNFTSSCMSCFLSLLEFVAYDPGKKKFVSVNHRFKSEFEELLAKYDKVANEECRFQGKIMPVDEILKITGKEAKCEDDLRPGGNEYFMTIGEFNQIREDIQKVIDGEKDSLMEYYKM